MIKEIPFDERRRVVIPGDRDVTLNHAASLWLNIAKQAIAKKGFFAVALSGGSTPKAIYQTIVASHKAAEIDWTKVYLFWSDERAVVPTHPDSNYHMSMLEGKLSALKIPQDHIFRMQAEANIEENALLYEKTIQKVLKGHPFDLIMLGVGDDGHTASLFPRTQALQEKTRLVVANEVSQKKAWRMTFTYPLINEAHYIHLYVLGAQKADVVEKLFTSPVEPERYPSQKIGTKSHPALWILDEEASQKLMAHLK